MTARESAESLLRHHAGHFRLEGSPGRDYFTVVFDATVTLAARSDLLEAIGCLLGELGAGTLEVTSQSFVTSDGQEFRTEHDRLPVGDVVGLLRRRSEMEV